MAERKQQPESHGCLDESAPLNRYRKVFHERKTRTPPKSARQKNAKARAGNNMDTKKRRRLDESPGLVQMFSPGAPSSSDSESSLSFRKHIAHGKKQKKESSLRKQNSKDSFLDDDSDSDEDEDEDDEDFSSFEDDDDHVPYY
jgi:hypothetical protein